MVAIDLSGLSTFIPVFGFLLVFTVTYALLGKTKALGENKFVHLLVSFAVSIIFLVSANAVEYVKVVTPWFAAFVISLLLIILVVGLIKGNIEDFFKPGFGWFIVIVLILIFLFSAISLFGTTLTKYLAGPKTFLLQPQVLGVVILLVIAAIVSWLLVREAKK